MSTCVYYAQLLVQRVWHAQKQGQVTQTGVVPVGLT